MKNKVINTYKAFIGCVVPNWLLRRKEISQGAKLLYGRLSQYAGKNGKAYPKMATLADEVGVSRQQASTYMNELLSHKLIKKERRGLGKPNTYHFLNHEWIEFRDVNKSLHQEVNKSLSPDVNDNDQQEVKDGLPSLIEGESSLKESAKESVKSRKQIRKNLNGFGKPLFASKLFSTEGFSETFLDYWESRKENYNHWPKEVTVKECYRRLEELREKGNNPVEVLRQAIRSGGKELYPARDKAYSNGDEQDQSKPQYLTQQLK